MKDRRGENEKNWAHSRVLIVLNFIATGVSDNKKKRRREIRNFYRMIVDYSCVIVPNFIN